MQKNDITFIYCEELQIAASCETHNNKVIEVYNPSTLLLYVGKGQLNIKYDQDLFTIATGEFALLRKCTQCSMFKTWSPEEKEAITFGFSLTNKFIRKVIGHFDIPKSSNDLGKRYLKIPSTGLLKGLIQSVIAYIDDEQELDPKIVEIKTYEALLALTKADPNLLSVFKEFSLSERADLEQLMHHNFRYDIPLEELAKQSGRSLSTFHREFKILFNDTPHNWIKKRRLQYAKNLMEAKNKKPSEVYLESGFKDLAHFSKSFKRLFSITPSAFYKSLQ